MSGRQNPADELDDAEYRALLAPLAKAVLPAAMRSEAPLTQSSRHRRGAILAAGLFGTAGLLAAGWLGLAGPRHVPAFVASAKLPPAPSPPAVAQIAVPNKDLIGILLKRGNAAMASGDITAARLLYQRAADAGSAEAALALSNTYEVDTLLAAGARLTEANPVLAAQWHRRAAELTGANRTTANPSRDGSGQ